MVFASFFWKNAAQFYQLLKEQHIDWTIFSCATLTRFDLAYSRFLKSSDNITVSDFLIKTQKRVLEIPRKVRFESNDLGVILKIGSRKSIDYVRIYKKKHNNYFAI
jgi:DNA relaxase NicK